MFKHLSISGKLWTAVAALIIAMMGIVALAAWRSVSQQQAADAALKVSDDKLHSATVWATKSSITVARVVAGNLSSDPIVAQTYAKTNADMIADINRLQKHIEGLSLTDKDRAQMAKITELRAQVLAMHKGLVGMKAAGQHDEVRSKVIGEFAPLAQSYADELQGFIGLQEAQSAEIRGEIATARRSITATAGIMVMGVLLLTAIGARFLIRSIQAPLKEAVRVASHIAQGDLSVRVDTSRTDEFGELMQALNGMVSSLGTLVHDVRQSTDAIYTASTEIATGNHDLSTRTEQTASSLQETASSMEQLTSTVAQSAQAASQANQLATSASDAAQRGGQVVHQVVATMEEIATASRKINDIIGVIDGIAFQTNILALNAAVEAARAGEQGRGFAVVASEVRSLAQRSANAAREIKGLIAASGERVDSGAQLVGEAGQAMTEIVNAIQRVTDMMGDISASTSEQSDGIHQVSLAVSHLDQMTQQNAALVEQSAAASQSMRDQAQRLSGAVNVFRTA
ncbi:MAG: HAMP domain-containing protein [Aquabacterium sp.]|uniref:methyl-accepting chemotaxis protein n=2 Tax=Aquabacterium TaxID=92793 RepID=UPI001E041E37|nr:methyl-accepting chemotaxis protein [Aquabacterium sp.]MBT9609429.1 HAMP domain-containing protein [Aquabacterium sp.]